MNIQDTDKSHAVWYDMGYIAGRMPETNWKPFKLATANQNYWLNAFENCCQLHLLTSFKISEWDQAGPLLSRFWWFVRSQDPEVIGGFSSHYSHTAKTRLFRKVKLFGMITAKMRCCIMLFYYDLLHSPTGVVSSLFGIVNSIWLFCILLCIYTFYYVLPLDNIRYCILLF